MSPLKTLCLIIFAGLLHWACLEQGGTVVRISSGHDAHDEDCETTKLKLIQQALTDADHDHDADDDHSPTPTPFPSVSSVASISPSPGISPSPSPEAECDKPSAVPTASPVK